MTENDYATPRPIVATIAYYVMLVLGILSLASVPWRPEAVLPAVLFFAVALGIRRRHAWSAYGFALLTLAFSAAPFAGEMLRNRDQARFLLAGEAFNLAIVLLLFFAGRELERRYGRRGMAWPWIGGSVFTGGFFLLFGLFQMPTGSMEKTLLPGDRIAVWKTHGATPVRGELVAHIYPVNRRDIFIKRVVAIPGDRVQIRNKQLFVNGAPVSEDYAEHVTSYMDSYRDNFPSNPSVPLYPQGKEMLEQNVVNGEVVVPPGKYFVLGDNRDESLDSRYWGFIETSDIIGTPKMVYYSVKSNQNPSGAKGRLPILNLRWDRMFRTLG